MTRDHAGATVGTMLLWACAMVALLVLGGLLARFVLALAGVLQWLA